MNREETCDAVTVQMECCQVPAMLLMKEAAKRIAIFGIEPVNGGTREVSGKADLPSMQQKTGRAFCRDPAVKPIPPAEAVDQPCFHAVRRRVVQFRPKMSAPSARSLQHPLVGATRMALRSPIRPAASIATATVVGRSYAEPAQRPAGPSRSAGLPPGTPSFIRHGPVRPAFRAKPHSNPTMNLTP